MSNRSRLYTSKLANTLMKRPWAFIVRVWQSSRLNKIMLSLLVFTLLVSGLMYGISRWYVASESDTPQIIGTSFIPAYAESLGLDAEDTMDALLDDLGVRHFRLVSYWNQLEPEEGKYDFSMLDWQMQKAEEHDAKVTLSIGLRQPRWPECHMPDWAKNTPEANWQPKLEKFIAAVVVRYKDSPALQSYQLENEYYLASFGECPESTQERLISEYLLVKSLDQKNPVILSRSNNFPTLPKSPPTPDIYGISVYRRVWDGRTLKDYFTYPMPSWYYSFLAGIQKLSSGKPSVLHELQAEAWPPNGQGILETSLYEQNESFDARRFEQYIKFGKDTGMREIYTWGSEYWYYRKEKLNDPSLWNVAKDIYKD
jgi:hypothetical protein